MALLKVDRLTQDRLINYIRCNHSVTSGMVARVFGIHTDAAYTKISKVPGIVKFRELGQVRWRLGLTPDQ